jgi:hypothetical protein
MTKYQNTSSDSSVVTLDVSAQVVLGAISTPAVGPFTAGQVFSIGWTGVPVVSGSGNVVFSLRTGTATGPVVMTKSVTVLAGDLTCNASMSTTMGSADTMYYVTAVDGAGTAIGGVAGGRLVELLTLRPTTSSISIRVNGVPGAVAKPTDTLVARLTLSCPTAPNVVGETMRLETGAGALINTGVITTGTYIDVPFTNPGVGTYTYRAAYNGSAILASSMSSPRSISLAQSLVPLLILAGLTYYVVAD